MVELGQSGRVGRAAASCGSGILCAAVCVGLLVSGCGGSKPDPNTRIDFADIPRLKAALEKFKQHCGRYPTTAEGLQALLAKPQSADLAEKWAGPYVKREEDLKDPYDHIYQYAATQKDKTTTVFRIWSAGRDGESGNADDYPQPSDRTAKPGTERG